MNASQLVSELREGCKQTAKRWSGDVGECSRVNEPATNALMLAAADEIERLRSALMCIRDFAGTTEGECGVAANASWCAEQARSALWLNG